MNSTGIIVLLVIILLIILVLWFGRQRLKRTTVMLDKQIGTAPSGKEVTATVTDILAQQVAVTAHLTFQSTNYRTEYVVVAQWTDPVKQQTYTFHSVPLTEVPKKLKVGSLILVRIDPADPQNSYTMDTILAHH